MMYITHSLYYDELIRYNIQVFLIITTSQMKVKEMPRKIDQRNQEKVFSCFFSFTFPLLSFQIERIHLN